MLYPLDMPKQSLWQQIAYQPLPGRPEGFFLSDNLYRASLHPLTPLTIGFVYICAVFWANARNRSYGGKKPKDLINSSPTLKNLVLAHNLLLAIYSGWTCTNVVVRLAAYFMQGLRAGGLEGELKRIKNSESKRVHIQLTMLLPLCARPHLCLLHCAHA